MNPLRVALVGIASLLACGGHGDLEIDPGASDARAPDGSIDAISAAPDAGLHDAHGDGGPEVLSTKAEHALAIAVDATRVYWTNNEGGGSVMACDKTSCEATLTSLGGSTPWGVVTDGQKVYWTEEYGGVYWAPAGGGSAPKLLAPSKYPTNITERAGVVYWSDQNDGAIYACPTTGCATPSLVAKEPVNASMHGLAVDATNAYWTLDHSIHTCPLTGCAAPITVVDIPAYGNGIAVDAKNLYWATAPGALIECPLGQLDGGEALLASSPGGGFIDVAVDDTNVYWTDLGDGAILKCPIAGCAHQPTVLATGQMSPYGIALDATSVYWVNHGGFTVMRTAK